MMILLLALVMILLLYACIVRVVGPNATDVSVSPLYFIAGSNVSLIAFIDIKGNPEPSSNWTLNSSAITVSDIRFNTLVPGQLSITNISSADVGTYMCTLGNGNAASDVSATIELSEAGIVYMNV